MKYPDRIIPLKDPNRVRERPAIFFGTVGAEGCKEIFKIVLAEFELKCLSENIKDIYISVNKDGSFEIKVYSNTSILSDIEDGIPIWKIIFENLYSEMHIVDFKERKNPFFFSSYARICAVQYVSDYMCIRDHDLFLMYEKGYLKEHKCVDNKNEFIIKWKPDIDVFENIDIEEAFFKTLLDRRATVVLNTNYHLRINNTVIDICYKSVSDRMKHILKSRNDICTWFDEYYICGKGYEKKRANGINKCEVSIAFGIGKHIGEKEFFHNFKYVKYGGSLLIAIKNTIIKIISGMAINLSLNKKDVSTISDMLYERLYIVAHSKCSEFCWGDNAKNFVDSIVLQRLLEKKCCSIMKALFVSNKELIKELILNKSKRFTLSQEDALNVIKQNLWSSRVIFIDGRSGSGKTYLVRKLKSTLNNTIEINTSEHITAKIIEFARNSGNNEDLIVSNMISSYSCDILCIEDIDFLSGREYVLKYLLEFILEFIQRGTVIMTGIDIKSKMKSFINNFDLSLYIEIERGNEND